eukprot:Plantae.Rhodophyta-Purpureofilum_apyrenoidigerum.ctg2352.p1 GENE.Plantae.Rhodophyta-Purpureofilum_apyrenoidigerum.ctg2352~~Plantae.Rhodophyta-Purpureofilum_apyrenoidigerum.ctg2352.p1  ORF type:complete len:499 (+),score=65.89 Plantae.Rhodophyta-Purpureofilum_apyrenoidigerum.ctg2352:52-1548(+)
MKHKQMNNTVTSEEVNYLVFRYLQESGYVHSAFAFGYESHIVKSNIDGSQIPPGVLLSFLQRGISYVAIESSLNDGADGVNDGSVSLLDVHRCLVDRGRSGAFGAREGDFGHSTENNVGSAAKSADLDGDRATIVPENEALVLQGHSSDVIICAWNPKSDLLASGANDPTARIWTLPSTITAKANDRPVESAELWHHSDNSSDKANQVTDLAWNSDGTKLATGACDGMARIWSDTGELLQTLNLHKGPIFSLKWNERGDFLLSSGIDKTTIIWKASTGRPLKQFSFHTGEVLDVDWRDDTSFASCSRDKKIFVCKYGEDDPLATFTGHHDEINEIKWDPSGKLLASCSDDCTAKIWSIPGDEPVHDFREHTKEIYSEKWCPNTNKTLMLATASFDTTVKLWDVNTGQCMSTLARHSDAVYSIAFSHDGNYLASGSYDKTLRIWSVKDGSIVRTYHGNAGIFTVSWNYNDDKVAASSANSTVVVIDPRTGTSLNKMQIG